MRTKVTFGVTTAVSSLNLRLRFNTLDFHRPQPIGIEKLLRRERERETERGKERRIELLK